MKHWKRLTKIDLTKNLPFSSMFLEIYLLLGTNQSWSLSVKTIVSEFFEQHADVITEGGDKNEDEEPSKKIVHTPRNKIDEAIETLNR